MSILSTTNITTMLIRNTLGEASNKVSVLCTSPNINMFSHRKPVREARISIPADEVGEVVGYGLEVPIWDGTNQVWTYLKPRGGSSEPYRLGDFRGYSHDAGIPVRMDDYTSRIFYIAYNSLLIFSGIASFPDPDSPGIAWPDVLPDYYFACQLKNEANEIIWGTHPDPESFGINIDFSETPFNTANWQNSVIEIKFFFSSVAKTFAEADKTSIKKAMHYHSTSNKTTQTFTTLTEAYVEAEITAIANDPTSATWFTKDGIYDPENLPVPLETAGPVALKVKFRNKLPDTITIGGAIFKFGTMSNYHSIERFINFTGTGFSNMYDLSGNPITELEIAGEQWSSEIILYDGYMLNFNGTTGQIPDPAVIAFYDFDVKMLILGSWVEISNWFNKRCASNL